MATTRCPNCGAVRSYIFHRIPKAPVNSCLLFASRDLAERVETGDIDLAFCPDCSFIFNAAWKPGRTVYSDLYEETQSFSPTFSAFHRKLADELIRRYDLVGKEIVEIGCGKGEFLALLCELGDNRGIGYDPSFIPERNSTSARIIFKREFFSETTIQSAPDFVCCKMTLEHIFETRLFAQAVRRIASPERGTIIFFQVPDVRRILAEAAFWDVYYEHCAYFSPASLAHLFRSTGFEILRISAGFDEQYLMIEARASAREVPLASEDEGKDAEQLASFVASYAAAAERGAADWASRIGDVARAGGRIVLWGSGSKAVAFLAAVRTNDEVGYLIDVNPYRRGKFVPGTGKQIQGPSFVAEYKPDLVIAMNPIYRAEIARDLAKAGCENAVLHMLGEPSIAPAAMAEPSPSRLHA